MKNLSKLDQESCSLLLTNIYSHQAKNCETTQSINDNIRDLQNMHCRLEEIIQLVLSYIKISIFPNLLKKNFYCGNIQMQESGLGKRYIYNMQDTNVIMYVSKMKF